MTTIIRPTNRSNHRATTTPSEVWDLDRAAAPSREVRQLAPQTRTPYRPPLGGELAPPAAETVIEPDRESRDNLLLGALMAGALLIGSIVGGAFDTPDAANVGAPSAPAAIASEGSIAQAR